MRADPAAALIRARLTHQVPVGFTTRGGDALAIVESGDGPLPAGQRLFVPGVLPCGECPACRRALCDACTSPRPVVPGPDGRRIEVSERFVVAIDEAAHSGASERPESPRAGGVAESTGQPRDLAATELIAAGLVSDILGAGARAGLGPGETAIWIGHQPWARVGASWSIGRGCRTFVLSSPASGVAAGVHAGAVALDLDAGPSAWRTLIAEAEAAGGPAGGRPERRIFVCGDGPHLARAAIALATAGSTLSFLLGVPSILEGLDIAPPLRLFTGGGGQPDLIVEALAAIRRGHVDVDGAFAPITVAERQAAVATARAGLDRPLPVIAFDA